MVCYLDLRPVSKQKNITLHHQVWRETASLRACRIPFAGREHMFQNAELRSSSGRQWPRTPHDGLDQWAVRSLREAVSHAAACVVCGTVYTTSARKKYQVFSITWINKWRWKQSSANPSLNAYSLFAGKNTGKVPSFGLTGERTREFWHVDQLLGRPFP
jgi:hypothetical protein